MRHVRIRSLAIVLALLGSVLLGPSAPVAAQTTAVAAPTPPTPTEMAYLSGTEAFRTHLGELHAQLAGYQQLAATEQLGTITMSDLGTLTRELFAAQLAFASVQPSARLDQYDQTVKLGLDHSYTAASLLLRARVRESAAEQEVLVHRAGIFTASSARLLHDAAVELAAIFPALAQ